MPATRPAAVVFDVNETLFSFDLVVEGFAEAGLPFEAVTTWYARVLRDGIAHAATGGFAAFRDLAAAHLENLLAQRGSDRDPSQVILDVLGRFRYLRAHPDVEPALTRLRDAGLQVVTLTNGHADTVAAMLEHAGLSQLVQASLSADEAGYWKPRPEPYHHAATACGVDPAQVALVAVHSWDIHGANRAGLTTGYASRLERDFVEGFDPPHVRGESLVEVVDGLLALPPA